MRTLTTLLCGTILGIAASTAALAAAHPAPSPKIQDCRNVEKEVSLLMDAQSRAPKISEAKFFFQMGHMHCLEGNDREANKNYGEIKKLLTSETRPESRSRSKARPGMQSESLLLTD